MLGVGGVCGECGVCVGRVWCVGCAWGVWSVWLLGKERLSLAPLYYPDTLVNPDTCLGLRMK